MKLLSDVKSMQLALTSALSAKAVEFVAGLPKDELQAVLLSGSCARGDYFPGEYGAKIDLTIMKRKGSALSAEALLGKNEDPEIPYHCVSSAGEGYQVAFHELMDADGFRKLGEAKKFALMESKILWESDGVYSRQLGLIKGIASEEQKSEKAQCLSYIGYLLSDYKVDRWTRREAYPQLHANLNTAIGSALKCLYYANVKYAPAVDRRMYYSYSLERLPSGYGNLMRELFRQDIDSESDYSRREKLFRKFFLAFLESAS